MNAIKNKLFKKNKEDVIQMDTISIKEDNEKQIEPYESITNYYSDGIEDNMSKTITGNYSNYSTNNRKKLQVIHNSKVLPLANMSSDILPLANMSSDILPLANNSSNNVQLHIQHEFPTEGHIIIEEKELAHLITEITEIKEISKAMNELLSDQTNQLGDVTNNIDKTDISIEKATSDLNEIKKNKNSGMLITISIVTGALIGSIFGPIGTGIGIVAGVTTTKLYDVIAK